MDFSFVDAALEVPDHPALIVGGVPFTFQALLPRVLERIEAFRQHGIHRIDDALEPRVALVATPSLETALNVYALLELQATMVLMHPRWTDLELERAIGDSRPRLVIDRAGSFQAIDTTGEVEKISAHVRRRWAAAGEGQGDLEEAERILAILYTSGTTGRPRGAMLSRGAFRASASASAANLGWREDDRWLLQLPMAHVGGLSILLRCLSARRCVVLPESAGAAGQSPSSLPAPAASLSPSSMPAPAAGQSPSSMPAPAASLSSSSFPAPALGLSPDPGPSPTPTVDSGRPDQAVPAGSSPPTSRFEPADLIRVVERDRVTLLSIVPTMLQRLLEHPSGWNPPSYLRAILLGGAAASPRQLNAAADRGWPVLTSYGLTEACSQLTTQRYGSRQRGEAGCGEPLERTGIRIVGDQIEVCGPQLMSGYFPPGAHLEPFLPDGWLATGDLGRLDEAGCLHILARRTDLIVTGGENVYPAEVEQVLEACPGIGAACVFGIDDEAWGQQVAVALVASGVAPGDDVLQDWLCARLAPFKHPRKLSYLSSLPLNPTGKIDRVAVGRQAGPLLRSFLVSR